MVGGSMYTQYQTLEIIFTSLVMFYIPPTPPKTMIFFGGGVKQIVIVCEK